MAKFLNPQGREVTADEALINGRLRPNYREIMTDGESIDFGALHLFNMDGASFIEPAKGRMFIVDDPKVNEASVASKLADQRHRETMDVLRKGRFIGHGKFIEAADSDNPIRPTIPNGMTQTDAIAYLRKARYS